MLNKTKKALIAPCRLIAISFIKTSLLLLAAGALGNLRRTRTSSNPGRAQKEYHTGGRYGAPEDTQEF